MAEFDWTAFLGEWSRELIASQEIAAQLPPEVKAAGWLGYAGASDEQIAHAEARLGRSLPPSYRAFLKCSNGWRNTGFFIDRLWSTDDLEWFRVRHQEWISDWNLGEAHHATTNPGQSTGGGTYEGAALPFTLEISDVGDSAIYFVEPARREQRRRVAGMVLQQLEPGRSAIPVVPADDRERAQAVPARSGS